MPIRAYNFTYCLVEFVLPSLFINVNNACGKGMVIALVLNNSNIFYSHFALDIFNAKQFFRQKIIEKFNDESQNP
jgi:hypothetical protein